jgi:hypothetical protein
LFGSDRKALLTPRRGQCIDSNHNLGIEVKNCALVLPVIAAMLFLGCSGADPVAVVGEGRPVGHDDLPDLDYISDDMVCRAFCASAAA